MPRQRVFPFVVGSPRSGTTLLRAILNSHPDLAVPMESRFIPHLLATRRYVKDRFSVSTLRDVLQSAGRGWWTEIGEVLSEELQISGTVQLAPDLLLRRMFELYALREGKRRYAEKSPLHVRNISELAALLPEARFLHIVRDGRNAVLSLLDSGFSPKQIEEAIYGWRRAVFTTRRAGMALEPQRYREIRYEELIDDAELVIREICIFFELDFDPKMLRYYERADQLFEGEPIPDHLEKLKLPPTVGLRDWRRDMHIHNLTYFDLAAGDALDAFGYKRSETIPSAGDLLMYVARTIALHARRLCRFGKRTLSTMRGVETA